MQRLTAGCTGLRKPQEFIRGNGCDRHFVAIGKKDFRVVEGSCLVFDSGVCEVQHEFDDSGHACGISLKFRDTIDIRIEVIEIGVEEVCPAGIELHDLFKRLHATIVHVGPGEFDVSQCGCFEGTVDGDSGIRADGFGGIRISTDLFLAAVGEGAEFWMICSQSDVFLSWSYTDVIETSIVICCAFFHGHKFNQSAFSQTSAKFADGGTGEFRSAVAIDATTGTEEDFHTFLCLRAQCLIVAAGKVVDWCFIRDERGLVHHECESPVEREIGFHLGIAVSGELFRRPPFRAKRGGRSGQHSWLTLHRARAPEECL
jgi:hypothetical protein